MTPRYLLLLALGYLVPMAYGLDLKGHVTASPSGCPVPGLTVEVDPVRGSSQPKVITSTDLSGNFSIQVANGRYLVQLFQNGSKVYQRDLTSSGSDLLAISLSLAANATGSACSAAPADTKDNSPSTLILRAQGSRLLRPSDLSTYDGGGFLVLDDSGQVTHVFEQKSGLASANLFTLPANTQGIALTSANRRVYVTANSMIGCSVFEFDEASRRLTPHPLGGMNRSCGGVTSDGGSLAVAFSNPYEIIYIPNFDFSKPHAVEINGMASAANLLADGNGRLLIGDNLGKVFEVTYSQGGGRQVLDRIGFVNSLAVSNKYLLVASGKKLLCYNRSSFSPVALASCVDRVPYGDLAGVRVDGGDRAWVLLRDRSSVTGPLVLK